MNKELQIKMKKYSVAAATLVTASGVNAQIVYSDVDPDFVHVGDDVAVGLDLNNDASFDFLINSSDSIFSGVNRVRTTWIAPYGTAGNAIAGEAPSGYNYALALNSSEMIDNTLNWISASNTMAYNVDSSNPYSENWNGVTDKYLGLKFSFGGSTYYGWARLDVDAIGDAWTLKDYAYESTADTGITAGTVGLEEGDLDQLVHFINQQNNTVLVKVNGDLTEGAVTIVAMSGQTISTGAIENNSFVVNMSELTSGMYMINVTFREGSITKKMIVTK